MPLAPLPTPEEIVTLFNEGYLAIELARYHEETDDPAKTIEEVCISLHNAGRIDLMAVPVQPAFKEIEHHSFFTAQQFYCRVIPRLNTTAAALMTCCDILIKQAGNDGAARFPFDAFSKWCRKNLDEASTIIKTAREGDDLSKHFLAATLQGVDNIDTALDFIAQFDGERRFAAIASLGGMTFPDRETAQKVVAVLQAHIADPTDDGIRERALAIGLGIIAKHLDADDANQAVVAATVLSGPLTQHSLAYAVWQQRDLLSDQSVASALEVLKNVDPSHLGIIRILDIAVAHLLGTSHEDRALDFLTYMVGEEKLALKSFEATTNAIARGSEHTLYKTVVLWLLSGNFTLANSGSDLVGIEKDSAFSAATHPTDLTAVQQIFLSRKAIGFLFAKPVVCCSVIVSVLRVALPEAKDDIANLLFDPMLINYSGGAKDYLAGIQNADPAYDTIQSVLAKEKCFMDALGSIRPIKELSPSDYQRDVFRQKHHDNMRAIQKQVNKESVLLQLVTRSVLLHGRSSLTYITDTDGSQRSMKMDLHPIGVSLELPRHSILDPAGLEYLLAIFRVERFK